MPTATPSSPRCVAFFANLRCNGGGGGGGAEQRTHRSPCGPRSAAAVGGCARLDRVAAWVGGGVAAAFFASLERCSCVRVPADDDRDDARDAAGAAPLICHDGNAQTHPHPHPLPRRTSRAKGN
ncbi:hypothetical protein ACMD2_08174 [Ananas comosus]|uniref:Uncharacterized protein n=1 Tax=Ananas comosus TaxID=4615 RepID=A0A199VNV5_ANACO|nr:hypothetical protein ACMD2_08174 [Ananas comosus]